MSRLLLLTPSELTRDPRARRAAAAAQKHGLEVVGLCGRASGEHPVSLDRVAVRRVGPRRRSDPVRETGLRSVRRQSAGLRELRGLYRLARLAVRTLHLWRAGTGLGRVEIIHANDFDTLPAAWLLARSPRAWLVYDAHELYSAFEPNPPWLYRRVADALEGALARRADAVVTVSEPIARELERRLRLKRAPIVVLNVPEVDEREPLPGDDAGPLRAIYQGSFGTGRPVEELLEAVRRAPSVHLTIRAVRIEPRTLRTAVAERGLAERVNIAEPLPPDRVGDGLRGFDVGLIFDRPVTRNGELSLPNKLFEYLMAGLAVVAPSLPALAPILERHGVGLTFEPGPPDRLAATLEQLAQDRQELVAMRERARRLALERYNAEAQAGELARAWGLS